jgi:predicted phage terminase large subunit-like protein
VKRARLVAFVVGVVALAACSSDPEVEKRSAVEHGKDLFADAKVSTANKYGFSCSTCHRAEAAAGDTRQLPGYDLGGAVDRPTFWGGQRNDLLAAINDCRYLFMNAPQAWRGDMVPECIRRRFEGTWLENGDPRSEGELLWPEFRDETASDEMAIMLTSFRAAGQLQQRPAAREGELLLRAWWRFYDPRFRGLPDKLPKFSRILISGDYPSKDKESNDLTAIQCWGVAGGDRYLLDLEKGHYNYLKALRRTEDMANWARRLWPRATQQILIENAGFGPELILDLKRRITGVQKINPQADGDKVMRAETASADLESGNCFLPGYGPPWQPAFDETASPADICDFVHSAAVFPNGAHDDDVDAWSQAMNWIRLKAAMAPMRTSGLHHLVTRR